LGRIKAGVHATPPRPQPGGGSRVTAAHRGGDVPREFPARRKLDMHAEEVAARLGEDLGQPSCVAGVAAGDHVLAAAAFEEHNRFEEIGVDAAAICRALDQRPEARAPLGCGEHPAGALRIEDVSESEAGRALERAFLPRHESQRVTTADVLAGNEKRWLPTAAEREKHGADPASDQRDQQDRREQPAAAVAALPARGLQDRAGDTRDSAPHTFGTPRGEAHRAGGGGRVGDVQCLPARSGVASQSIC
jgi:hypothetical protein